MAYSMEYIMLFLIPVINIYCFCSLLEHKNYGQVLHQNHNEEDGWTSRPFR